MKFGRLNFQTEVALAKFESLFNGNFFEMKFTKFKSSLKFKFLKFYLIKIFKTIYSEVSILIKNYHINQIK